MQIVLFLYLLFLFFCSLILFIKVIWKFIDFLFHHILNLSMLKHEMGIGNDMKFLERQSLTPHYVKTPSEIDFNQYQISSFVQKYLTYSFVNEIIINIKVTDYCSSSIKCDSKHVNCCK